MNTPTGNEPTEGTAETRTIRTSALARVEGEGAMRVEIRDGELVGVELQIYEPPRFFEAFLRGRSHTEPPDLTARICGICPVAYQMSACAAIEDALGVDLDGDPTITDLRHLLYCGEWIESHTLHIHLLHAPDFHGCANVVDLAAIDRAAVERGLELKKIGNHLLDVVGGRAIHPINVKIGGFHRFPDRRALGELRVELDRGLELADQVVDWVAGFDMPDREIHHELMAVDHPTDYPMLGRRIRTDGGLDIDVAEFSEHVEEFHLARSTALHAHLPARGRYLVGPLARHGLHAEKLAPAAAAAAARVGLESVCRNPFRSIVVRAVEVVHAFATAIELVDRITSPATGRNARASVPVEPRAGVGHGVTEAPRGLLYHRYAVDPEGLVTDAVIVPPTAQNQPAIEHDLWQVVERELHRSDDDLRHLAEMTIRNHDPCISCATHFLDLTVDRS